MARRPGTAGAVRALGPQSGFLAPRATTGPADRAAPSQGPPHPQGIEEEVLAKEGLLQARHWAGDLGVLETARLRGVAGGPQAWLR